MYGLFILLNYVIIQIYLSRGYHRFLQKTTTDISSPDLGYMHHYNCKFTKMGLGTSMNSIFMPSGKAYFDIFLRILYMHYKKIIK